MIGQVLFTGLLRSIGNPFVLELLEFGLRVTSPELTLVTLLATFAWLMSVLTEVQVGILLRNFGVADVARVVLALWASHLVAIAFFDESCGNALLFAARALPDERVRHALLHGAPIACLGLLLHLGAPEWKVVFLATKPAARLAARVAPASKDFVLLRSGLHDTEVVAEGTPANVREAPRDHGFLQARFSCVLRVRLEEFLRQHSLQL